MPKPESQNQEDLTPEEEIVEPEVKQVSSKLPMDSVPHKSATVSVAVMVIVALVVGLIGFSAALYLGGSGAPSLLAPSQGGKSAVKKGSYEDGYQAGLDFAKDRMQKRGILPIQSEAKYLYAVKVKSVSGNSITVEFDATVLDFFSEGMVTKTVTVPDTVKIIQNVSKSQDEVQKAYDEFNKKMESYRKAIQEGTSVDPSDIPVYPETFTKKEVAIGELNEGDIVNITSDTDISKADTFAASSIELMPVTPVFTVPPSAPTVEEPIEEPADNVTEDLTDTTETTDTTGGEGEEEGEGESEGERESIDTTDGLKEVADEMDEEDTGDAMNSAETSSNELPSEEENETTPEQ